MVTSKNASTVEKPAVKKKSARKTTVKNKQITATKTTVKSAVKKITTKKTPIASKTTKTVVKKQKEKKTNDIFSSKEKTNEQPKSSNTELGTALSAVLDNDKNIKKESKIHGGTLVKVEATKIKEKKKKPKRTLTSVLSDIVKIEKAKKIIKKQDPKPTITKSEYVGNMPKNVYKKFEYAIAGDEMEKDGRHVLPIEAIAWQNSEFEKIYKGIEFRKKKNEECITLFRGINYGSMYLTLKHFSKNKRRMVFTCDGEKKFTDRNGMTRTRGIPVHWKPEMIRGRIYSYWSKREGVGSFNGSSTPVGDIMKMVTTTEEFFCKMIPTIISDKSIDDNIFDA